MPPGWRPNPPSQSNAKSKLISEYLAKFQLVTKGGLYIDGFAGPQKLEFEEAWTARRVLEIHPPRIRTLWLCDIEPSSLLRLRKLKEMHHAPDKQRRVFVMPGDFNDTVKLILNSGRLTRRAAIFALLDQRTNECHWRTVKALAARAGRHKIELMYFLGTSWLHRSILSLKRSEAREEYDRWWGGSGWNDLKGLSQFEAAQAMGDRFAQELGYRHVNLYPIYQYERGNKVSFHLIHASDHPEAPKLMARTYLEVVGDVENSPADSQGKLF